MKKMILFFVFLTISKMLGGQLYEIPLEQKIKESQLIIEGRVVKSESYIGADERIYTAHMIDIQRVFKGTEYKELNLVIITRGGEVSDWITTWSHLLTLKEEESGIFFLRPNTYPAPTLKGFPRNIFRVFSSSQGFLKYEENLGRRIAVSPFHRYENIEEELVVLIKKHTNEFPKVLITENKEEEDTCIIYTLEPVIETAFSSIRIGADIKVRSSEGSFGLYQSLIVAEYDTTFFGSNVVENGTIEVYDGDISGLSNYNLTVTDLTSNKIKIKLTSTGGLDSLFAVSEQKSFLARIFLQIENPFGSGVVRFDYSAMEEGNIFYDYSTHSTKLLNCLKIENEVFPKACPSISSFNPPTAAAGVGQQSLNVPPVPGLITIVGENFGTPDTNEYKPPYMKLGFTNAGPSGADWCYPPERDIISWSEDTIVVRVPSLNEDGNVKTYAGTGPLLIWNTQDTCFSYSTQNLYIPFCVTNLSNFYVATQTRESILTKIEDTNGEGGYDLYFGDNILTIDSVEQSFERALNSWRCTTGVNMVIKPKNEIADLSKASLIDMDITLPTGVTTTLAETFRTPEKCNDNTHSTQPKFEMLFSKYFKRPTDPTSIEINWHTSEAPMDSSMDTLPNRDFQTVALHELGHASILLHTNNTDNVMYKMHTGTKRTLTVDDLEGGIHAAELSVIAPHCQAKMTKFNCSTNSTSEALKLGRRIFPNPTYANINLEFDIIFSGKIILLDVFGRKLLSREIEDQLQVELNIRDFPRGIYFIALVDDYNQVLNSTKIIKR